MKITLVCVSKPLRDSLREVVRDYEQRIGRYAKFECIELSDGSESEVLARLQKSVPNGARVVAMEVEGKPLSSHELASYVENAQLNAVRDLVFVIGGSYGLPQSFSKAAHLRLSMSKMILPHRLARLILSEQIYRAFTILKNEPYSH